MPALLEITGNAGLIILTGSFDFSVQDSVRLIFNEALKSRKIKTITVDMAAVAFMDSSAIRLLLILNKSAAADGKSLTLINCHGSLREIFSIGGFDTVLTIR